MAVVTVKFFATIQEATGVDATDITIEQGRSVDLLLKRLVGTFGEKLRGALYDSSGTLRKNVTLMVNGQNVRVRNDLDTKLYDRDVVFIFTSVAGGWSSL